MRGSQAPGTISTYVGGALTLETGEHRVHWSRVESINYKTNNHHFKIYEVLIMLDIISWLEDLQIDA